MRDLFGKPDEVPQHLLIRGGYHDRRGRDAFAGGFLENAGRDRACNGSRPRRRFLQYMIQVMFVRIIDRLDVTASQDDAGIETVGQALKNCSGEQLVAKDLPKPRWTAAIALLVTVMK